MAPSLTTYVASVLPEVLAARARHGRVGPEDVREALNREYGLALTPADDGRIAVALAARDPAPAAPTGPGWRGRGGETCTDL